ncbi:endonuclease/exonuclease/phosphatase family protein [Nannocystaceae bacterium ST9]
MATTPRTSKKSTAKKATTPKRANPPRSSVRFFDKESNTDQISRLLDAKNLVPERLRGTDKYLDIVCWNVRWFDAADPDRVAAITDVLAALNADCLVLTEVADDGALDQVVADLAARKAGFYSIHYGSKGGQQRVVMLWDRDWVRAKAPLGELFDDEHLSVPSEIGNGRQAVFPRLPVWGYFEARSESDEGFNFELVGLHLKAQGPAPRGYSGPEKRWGVAQRTRAALRLAQWLVEEEEHLDADVIVVGDWNANVGEKEWAPLLDVESQGSIAFESINRDTEISHMVRLNKGGPAGSRIDLVLVTNEAQANAVSDQVGVVVQWSLFDHLDALDGDERQELFKQLKQKFSDHLPVVSRFYLGLGS